MAENCLPDVTVAKVAACALPAWYDAFAAVTIKSKVIPLGDDAIAYLQSGATLRLPLPSDAAPLLPCDPRRTTHVPPAAPTEDSDSEDEEFTACFPDLEKQMLAAIAEYGEVFPRLSWTAPQARMHAVSPCPVCAWLGVYHRLADRSVCRTRRGPWER